MKRWDAHAYDGALAQGLSLSGEDADYFAVGRAAAVHDFATARGRRVERICELGCGLGRNLQALAAVFPRAQLVGIDPSPEMVRLARERCVQPRITFAGDTPADERLEFDLVFVNGVMHHVEPGERPAVMQQLRALLRPGGVLALFDNNPLNAGAMWVMRRIPFDRDAKVVLPWTLARLAKQAGFGATTIRTHFYFPNALRALRPLEPWLERVPLGAQYVLYADG